VRRICIVSDQHVITCIRYQPTPVFLKIERSNRHESRDIPNFEKRIQSEKSTSPRTSQPNTVSTSTRDMPAGPAAAPAFASSARSASPRAPFVPVFRKSPALMSSLAMTLQALAFSEPEAPGAQTHHYQHDWPRRVRREEE